MTASGASERLRLGGFAALIAIAVLFALLSWNLGRRGEVVVMLPALGAIAAGLLLRSRRVEGRGSGRTAGTLLAVVGAAILAFCAYLVLLVGAQPV